MLVVLSDLHFTDGSTAKNVNEGSWRYLASDITATLQKKDCKELHIVLLGDIFDFVRTNFWLELPTKERPWNGELDKDTAMNKSADNEKNYNEELDRIIDCEEDKSLSTFISVLNSIAETAKIPTKLTYVFGNHDRCITCYSSLRTKILSLFDKFDKTEMTDKLYDKNYAVLGRHGHEWDENNSGWQLYNYMQHNSSKSIGRFSPEAYKVQSIGEVVTCELMSGLIHYAKDKIGSKELISNLMNVNNIRPMTDAFSWLGWAHRHLSSKDKKYIIDAFKKALDGFLDTELSKKWDNLKTDWLFNSGDLVDQLQKLRTALGVLNYDMIEEIVDIVSRIMGDSEEDKKYLKNATKEFKKQENKDIRYILYGHTHKTMEKVVTSDSGFNLKVYSNTGTYLPLIQKTTDLKNYSLLKRMTIVTIYSAEEAKTTRPVLDYWSGLRTT